MKIAFDENVPLAMVRVFQLFQKENQLQILTKGLDIVKAQDFTPTPNELDYIKRSDAPWIRRFAKAGGRIIISGNTRMKNVPQERMALVEEKMIVFFFEPQWSNWQFCKKCALLMKWWPQIIEKAKKARPPKFYRIPSAWTDESKLRIVSTKDQRLIRIERQKAAQQRVAARRKRAKEARETEPQFDFGDQHGARIKQARKTDRSV